MHFVVTWDSAFASRVAVSALNLRMPFYVGTSSPMLHAPVWDSFGAFAVLVAGAATWVVPEIDVLALLERTAICCYILLRASSIIGV